MGGHSFPGSNEISDRSVGMVLSERYDGVSSTSSQVLECKGRPGVGSDTGFQRLKTAPVSFSCPAQQMGPFRGRPFCIQANTPTAQICQLETRSNGNLRGCIFRELERSTGVHLSPICPDRSLCTVGEVPESGSVTSSSTGMANPALVPIATATVCGSSTTISDVSSTSDQGRTVAPSEQSLISWVDAVDKSHETANVSEET
jgi:hypothetical protein